MRHTLLMKQLSLQYCLSAIKGVRKRGGWGYPPLSLIFYKNFIIWEVRRAWFFTKIRRVRVEEYAYYVNKLRLKTWIWLQIVTSQRAHTKYKWPPYATEWNPMEIFCVRHWVQSPAVGVRVSVAPIKEFPYIQLSAVIWVARINGQQTLLQMKLWYLAKHTAYSRLDLLFG